jgi:Amt family ammonium transporter
LSLSAGIGSLFYLLCGYALAFGEGNGFCGTRYFALVGLPFDKMAHCFFQYTFAATATTIVKSSLHERSSMTAYFTSIMLLSGLK